MRRVFFLSFIGFIVFSFAFAENITITTYYPAPFGVYKQLQTGSLEVRDDTSSPFIDFSNDAAIDYDARIELTGDNTLSIQGINRMDTCVLVDYPSPGVCPPCYFVGEFSALASGQMLCCRVSNPSGAGCP